MSEYRTRADQVRAFRRDLARDCSRSGEPLTRRQRRRIADAMKWACLVGGCEERSRVLGIVRRAGLPATTTDLIARDVCDLRIEAALGFVRYGKEPRP